MDPVCVMIGGLGAVQNPAADFARTKFLGLSVGWWIAIAIGLGFLTAYKVKRS